MGDKKSTNSRAGAGDRSNRQATEGTKSVKKKLGLTAVGGLGGDNKGYIAANLKGKNLRGKDNKLFYGEETSKFSNEYLENIGEAKKGKQYADGSYAYLLTSKGRKMKYGDSNVMGSGEKSSIMGGVPISEQMFESQRRVQGALIAGLSFTVPMFAGQIMRGIAADTMNSNYSNYLNKFNKNMKSNKSFEARNTGGNEQANNETANLAFGNTDTTQVANKSKTSKKFKKYLAGTGSDESSNKRTFYS